MSLKTRLGSLLAVVFGRLSWAPPAWLQRLWSLARANRRGLLGVFALSAVGAGVYAYVATRPPPPNEVQLKAGARNISAPARRLKADAVPAPETLLVGFDGSAAPLSDINKAVTAGVSIRPAIEGEWKWLNERMLGFTPKAPWPVGEKYKVSMTQQLVNRPNVVLATPKLEVTVEPFSASLASFVFYQDPVDPTVKQVVGTFRFNYPVDAESFEKRLKLESAAASNKSLLEALKYTVSYDDFRFEAYVRSENLPMPLEDHLATLTLKPGAKAAGSSSAADTEQQSVATIPGKGSKFRVNAVQATIATNAEGDPDQVLVFSSTSPVNENVFAAAVKVWVLPKDKPALGDQRVITNYSWSATEVGPEILKLSTRLKITAIAGEHEVGELQSFKVDANPGSQLFVRVEAGIEAYGGYVLLNPSENVVVVPEYPREIKIAHDGSVLSVSGDKKLTVTARGIPAFRVRLFQIQPKDLNHLITQAAGDFAHLSMRSGAFSEENISEVFSEVHTLDASNPRVAQYAAVDFSPYLNKAAEQRGMYFVRVEAWNPVTKTVVTSYSRSDEAPAPEAAEANEAVDREGNEGNPGDEEQRPSYAEQGDEGEGGGGYQVQLSDQRFVLLTDLGLIEKVDVGLNHWVYVQSFRTGAPLGGVQVDVLAKNGTILMHRQTEANGAVTLPSLKDFTAEKTPVALVARQNGDVSFLPLNRSDRSLDFSRFEVGGVRTHGRTGALTAFAFSDRGLYRPGETAHLTTLVRAVDWSRTMKGTPLVLNIVDPRGLQVAVKNVELDSAGLTGLDFRPEESAPTGTYTFNVSVPQPNGAELQLGSTTFRVEEFLPDRMRLSTHFEGSAQGWLTGSKLKAVAELRNLFGTPAADHRVEANVTLTPYSPRFSKYPDFQFFDPSRAVRSESMTLGESTTNAEGNSEYDVDLSRWAPSTWQVSFYAEGFELGGGRSVTSLASIIASPRKYMLGFKADGALGFVQRGSERKVQIIAVDPTLAQLKVEKLKLVLVEQRYVSVLTREGNGSYRYQSVLKDVTRKTDAFTVGEAGATLTVPNTEVGAFYWSVRDVEDVELSRVPFTIAGEANVAKELEKNAELKVSLDKTEYEPGETMTVQITAPYAGAGVITVERDRVLVHKAFKSSTSSTVQTIEVPVGLEVNGYVNVSFVRALDSPELYVSPLSYGVVPFTVLKKSQHLQLTLTAPELTKPGRPMTIKYKTDRPSKIVVFAVDEGILQVAKYQTPDPLAFFLEKRALEVSTRQIVDLLLPEFRLVQGKGKEGGDSDGALARNLNPFKRKTDAPAVFWSGIVDAGPDEKSVSFVVPESFNGSLRVMAVAASAEALAASKTSTTVRGPFVISPNTPTFVSPGDAFSVTAAIANNIEGSGDKASVTVTMKPSAAFVLAPGVQATQTLTIAEKREAVVSFDVKATEALGDGELQFLVSGAKQEVTRTAHVSVRPSSAYLVSTSAGTVKGKTAEVAASRTMFDQFATRRLTVSLLPLGLSVGLLEYLGHYPHLCSEQLTSRAVPGLVLMKRPEWSADATAAKASFETAFNVLRSRQNDRGQFGYWAANGFVSPSLDVFITLTLTEAKERGVAAPNDVRLKAIENLKQDQLPVSDMNGARLRAQALYVLARNAVVSPAPTAQLAEFLGRQKGEAFRDIAFAYLAATYQLTNNPQRAQELIKKFELSDDVVPELNTVYDNTVHQAQVLYLFSKHFPERLDAVGPKVLSNLARTMTSSGLHSLGASWSLYALDAYSTAVQGTLQGLKGVTIESKEASGVFKQQDVPGALTAKLAFTGATTGFKITAPEGVLLFYSVVESGFDKAVPMTAINEGVEVMHTFENDSGATITKAGLGDEITVRLRVRTLDKYSQVNNVALVDLLPSGFEVVQNRGTDLQGIARLASGGATWQPDSLDIREDRVNFYGTITPSVQELKYKIKAVAKGTFVVPPAQAVGMYRPDIRGRSTGGSFVVQ